MRYCLFLFLFFFYTLCVADAYQYVDKKGHTHLTSYPMGKGYKLVRKIKTSRKTARHNTKWRRNKAKYNHLVHKYALKYKLDPQLLHAIIQVESAYNPAAISSKGAIGLMQLMPDTAKRYGIKNRLDPKQNIHAGAHYLHDLLKLFNNNLKLAVASYNAGENAVKRYGKIPPYKETQQYVKKVFKLYKS